MFASPDARTTTINYQLSFNSKLKTQNSQTTLFQLKTQNSKLKTPKQLSTQNSKLKTPEQLKTQNSQTTVNYLKIHVNLRSTCSFQPVLHLNVIVRCQTNRLLPIIGSFIKQTFRRFRISCFFFSFALVVINHSNIV